MASLSKACTNLRNNLTRFLHLLKGINFQFFPIGLFGGLLITLFKGICT